MNERCFTIHAMTDCIELWRLYYRWRAIPIIELERIINNGSLPLYENIMPEYVYRNSDKIYLKKFVWQGRIVITEKFDEIGLSHCKIIEEYFPQDRVIDEYWESDPYDEDRPPRFFFLLSDVERIEQARPEHIDPNLATVDAITPAVPEIDTLRAENEKLKATIASLEKELAARPERPDGGKAAWRKEWGFLDYVITMIESGMSRDGVAKKLNEQNRAKPIVDAVTTQHIQEAMGMNISNVIVGAVTSPDMALVCESSLRQRARVLLRAK